MNCCKVCGQTEVKKYYGHLANGDMVCITCYSWWVGVIYNRIADLLRIS